MIDFYEIENINGEERLFLYINIDFEFGRLSLKEKKTTLENIVKKFIKENHIAFKGTIVSLILGGVIIGNVVLNNHTVENNYDVIPKVMETTKILEVPEEKNNIEIIIMDDESSKKDVPNINESSKESLNNQIIVDYKTNSTNKEAFIESKNNLVIEEANTSNSINENYVTLKRRDGSILNLTLENYLIGVLGAEMPATFNLEALKAQAVVARTYTLKSISTGKVLTDNESTQSYKSDLELKQLWGNSYETYYNKIKMAVLETEGEYLTYNNNYIEAVYHSTSNGKTEDASSVWGNYFPYLVSVSSIYDESNPTFLYEKKISYDEISTKLNITVNNNSELIVLSYTNGDRVGSISINGKIYSGVLFRNLLGLRSATFDFSKEPDGIKFTTKGYGHGVGMSQYGANGLAKNGYSYKDILKHYYPGVNILK